MGPIFSPGAAKWELVLAKDWSETPLGSSETWPQSLRTAVQILLRSRYAMWMGWGEDLTFFYNDAYRPTLGSKHRWALGSPAREVWGEVWPEIGPRFQHVLATGEATRDERLLLFLQRNGYTEETYHTFSSSPLADDQGAIVGILCVIAEETENIIGERRTQSLRGLASSLAGKNWSAEVLDAVERQLGAIPRELPFTLTYLFEPDGTARLASTTGIPGGHALAPAVIKPGDPDTVWPAGEVLEKRKALTLDLGARLVPIPANGWAEPARQAVVAPIRRQGEEPPAGFLAAAINPFRPLDEPYLGFIDLVAGQIASGLANARAYEEERRHTEASAEIDRARAEAAQERADAILATISDGFLAFDSEWRFAYVNAAAERMLGRKSSELIGKVIWVEYAGVVSATLEAHYRRVMTERVPLVLENFDLRRRRWFYVRGHPTRDGGIAIYFHDISERKAAEEALLRLNETLETQVAERTAELRDKEARLRTIFETSFTYQGLLAADGTLIDANATSLAGIGATLADLVGKPFHDTPWFNRTPGMSELVREAILLVARGETTRQEIRVNLPVGGWRWFDFQMRPLRDVHGQVIGIVPEAVEVTSRRHAEEALRQAQKMEGIGQLTGGVAHDFNNLLTVIVGNLETLQRQLKSDAPTLARLERLVEGAMRGAQRAASLTQHLLAFSRQQPLDPKPVDVSRLVTAMSDLLRRTIGETIAVETVLAGGLWRVNVDPNQLEIAIVNLAVNARDAMPSGGRLTIETANALLDEGYAAAQTEVAPGQYVVLAVSDNGIGMSADTLAKAFEPFFTTKDIGHGTGLGLSQVYGFVKQSGGHVKIYSELGEGTTVRIYLPRFHADDPMIDQEPIVKVLGADHGETILVVEDDDDVRAHTSSILKELGYLVLEAPDGKAALDILAREPRILLLFSDVGLPGGMNGRQLAEAARQGWPKLKVLFTTGYARNAIVHDGRLDPGVQLITKPFTYAALASKLRDMLDARQGPARVLLVEDEPLIQMTATDQLEGFGFKVEIAGTAADAKSRLRLLKGEVDAAIVDVGLPGGTGDKLVMELRAIYPTLPVVIATGRDETELRAQFKNYASMAFLQKPYTRAQLEAALRSIGVLG